MWTKTDISVKGRLFFLMAVFLCAFAGITVRVAYLQIVRGGELSAQASDNQSHSVDIEPKRGAILDRNGGELAVNTVVETISISPVQLKDSVILGGMMSLTQVADDLARLLDLDPDDVYAKIDKGSKNEILKKRAEPEMAELVVSYAEKNGLVGVSIAKETKRFYKNNNLAAHIIGTTTDDNRGLMGVEASMDRLITGTPGTILGDLDARRAEVPLGEGSRIAVRDGENVVLTIDTAIQLFATNALEKAIADNDVRRGGAAIIMDPRNGDILALVSKPDFNLNDPYAAPPGYSPAAWNGRSQAGTEILNQTVWRNKAIMDTYEPGSTFKPFTVAAALEEGVLSPDDVFYCEPITGYYDEPIKCWTIGNHGAQDWAHALHNSCNPALARISQRVTLSRFYRYIRDFGFYERTGVALQGESRGIFHTEPQEVDMLVASFGQRFTITPIELITAYASIANGGLLMKPRLVRELRDDAGNVMTRYEPEVVREVMSKDTSDKLREVLEGVVSEGTGRNAYISGYRVAGKTGTSETTEEDRKIASFCAFAPADDPVVCALVMLDDPKGENGHMGGAIAAPVVRGLLEEVLTYLEVERKYNERDLENQVRQIAIPDLRGKTVADAVKALQSLGLDHKLQAGISDTGLAVAAQTPQPYVSVAADSVVALYVDKGAEPVRVTVPDLTNKTVFEATEALNRAGLNIRISGSGVAKVQSAEPETEIEAGSVIEVSFRYTDNIE